MSTLATAPRPCALTRTPFGACDAVRDNPEHVEFIGYDPHVVRYLAYGFAGLFAGVAGGLAAINFEIANSAYLQRIQSGYVLFAAFIAAAYFFGPILGAILVTYLQIDLFDVTPVSARCCSAFVRRRPSCAGRRHRLSMMHRPLARAGSLAQVLPSYLAAAVPRHARARGRRRALDRDGGALHRQ